MQRPTPPSRETDREEDLPRNLLRLQRDLQSTARRFGEFSEKMVEQLDALAYAVEQLRCELVARGDVSTDPRRLRARPASGLRAAPRHEYASEVSWEENGDGSAQISIDGRPPFHLPPKLAGLLAILCDSQRPPSADGLVAWRRYADVAALLSKRTGRHESPARLTKAVSKLRHVFSRAGENPLLIESNRRGLVRFRLRIGPAPRYAAE